jgi:predicted CoA-substrate-specific enzyme activase
MIALGMDAGSVAVKAVAVRDDQPVAWREQATSPDLAEQCRRMLQQLRQAAGGSGPTCATGYGRNLVEGADTQISEIMANATGASWLQRHWGELEELFGRPPRPAALEERIRTIVDIGGQDSKVITFDSEGLVQNFAMNDRCAAGTGRFLQVMARALEVDLARLDAMALRADEPAEISSACTVFAESEVVSLLAEGTPRERVAAGVFRSVAAQVAGLARRTGWHPPVLFDGGPSHSRALRQALGRLLDTELAVPPEGQFATALGAALLAGDRAEQASAQPI